MRVERGEIRSRLYNDPVVQALLSGIVEERTELIPAFDDERMPRFILVENVTGKEPMEAAKFLEELADAEILRKEIYERLVCCPKCGSPSAVFPRYKCPKCGSLMIEIKRMVEHFVCGAVKEEREFWREGKMVCPVCGSRVKGLGVDCRLIGTTCICNSCGSSFEEPIHSLFCRNCDQEFFFSNARFMNVYKYSLNEAIVDEIMGAVALPMLKAAAEKAGFKVNIPGSASGSSGIVHEFTMTCEKNGIVAAVDLIQSKGRAVAAKEILASFAKFADVKPSFSVLIVVPRLTKEAATFADSNNIIRIEGESLEEAAKKFESFLISKRGLTRHE